MENSLMKQKKLVFTNGCFDVIHIGHVKLLEFCATLGTVIVGINSDASVKKIKGQSRPVNSENDRQFLLSSFRFVDKVVIFNEEDPYQLIKRLRPDIIVKGGDYLKSQVIGSDLAEVRIFPLIGDHSTSRTLLKLNEIHSLKLLDNKND
jgi:D-beta-D-heptose 7-phosphate kinase/D-beta-D-heptose 1-phosphate adenosyltransferase